ncbi:CheY-specific phosphatase CheX [Paenibacillus endophyticus]|uniref:CheY-specific phosphatase CheX n=1 Tax=Paenibacillus endophyticus TaxID=1294268 RepID=A0A7W5C7T9_9BACL|nr:hypothetical protein [Paenibacillus endophyticus]MBB3152557.1 CheY-specific phosphatase CheX [Paenibacillus endophyticus]
MDLFRITIEFSMYIKSANVVVITGKFQGEFTGSILVDATNHAKRFVVNNIVHMNNKNTDQIKATISLSLKPDDYDVDKLVGKCLINPD